MRLATPITVWSLDGTTLGVAREAIPAVFIVRTLPPISLRRWGPVATLPIAPQLARLFTEAHPAARAGVVPATAHQVRRVSAVVHARITTNSNGRTLDVFNGMIEDDPGA